MEEELKEGKYNEIFSLKYLILVSKGKNKINV